MNRIRANIKFLRSYRCYFGFCGTTCLFALFGFLSIVSAMTFPQDFDYSHRIEVLLDNGELWNSNSIFNPIEVIGQDSIADNAGNQDAFGWIRNYLRGYSFLALNQKKKSSEGLSVLLMPGIGIGFQKGAASNYNELAFNQFLWSEARLNKNWYARFYFRFTNEAASLQHYSGIQRSISRAGLNTGEVDQSIIGYQNSWANVEFGRNREIWGPFTEENLLLSGTAPAWERLMIQVHYKSITYRWFFGFLETIVDEANVDIQRYIIGKAIEYKNRKNFVIGLGEVSIIAGPNRPIDLAYLNPLALHIEVDMNQRSNARNLSYNNAIWFLHLDWLPVGSLRLSGSFIMDEIQLDQEDRDEGRPDALGWLGRVAWSIGTKDMGFTFFINYNRIGTYTMQYQNRGYLNFVTRDQLLGHPLGNDAESVYFGMRITSSYLPVLLELDYGRIRWGSNSIRLDSYQPYEQFIAVPFPSGEVSSNQYLSAKLSSQLKKGLSVNIDGHFDLQHSGEGSVFEAYTFSLCYKFPFLLPN
jgi:hypothetical protein